VGISVAYAAVQAGHTIFGIDSDVELIDNLGKGIHPMPGIKKETLISFIKTKKYLPTNQNQFISESDIVIIAVPTPLNSNKKPDLTYLIQACETIGKFVCAGTLIINESTSYPGTLRNIIKPDIERQTSLDLEYAVAPERVDPANTLWNVVNTPRVVSGLTESSIKRAIEFYASFSGKIYQAPSAEIAEASKLFENTFRQVNIALSNEFSQIANSLGFSAHEAIKAASTKPFGFMPFYPSIGVGGHCIPLDPSYLSYAAELSGSEAKFINLANDTNYRAHMKVATRIKEFMGGALSGVRIQIAGLAYKANVSDIRESPSILLLKELTKLGAQTSWCDPLVKDWNGSTSSPLDPNIDLGLIVAPHQELDFSIWKTSKVKVLDLSADSVNYGWPKFL
jgi:UDP-N-acetyl-D-glucosamine dehydrogenase